jgi:hypothetical protein
MAVFTVSVPSPFPQENRTYSGNLIDSLMETVEKSEKTISAPTMRSSSNVVDTLSKKAS